MSHPTLKHTYLLCGLIISLLFAACKKNNANDDKITPVVPGKDKDYTPIVVNDLPKLVHFRINGATCGFDTLKKIFYYPVASGTSISNYTVNFDSTRAVTAIIDGQKISSGGKIINYPLGVNQTINIRVINSLGTPEDYSLVVTNLPQVHITISPVIGDEYVDAYMELIDPDYVAHNGKLSIATDIQIRLRGVTARRLPKKSWAVHLTDKGGSDKDMPLLGLRDDNSWILDAMYVDPARMRNRLCTDIWNSFNKVPHIATEPDALNGTRGYMVEVFYNNYYRGIYCLTEKLDRKQLKVKKQYGNMYKANDATLESNFLSITAPYDNLLKEWGGWELEYPDLGDTPSPEWKYLYDEINFIGNSNDTDFLANIKNKVDIDNMVDYFIFMNITYATDNQAKNTFFSVYDRRNAPAFFYSPWDLDGTMGRDWGGYKVQNVITGPGSNNLLSRLLHLNAENFTGRLKKRWNELKEKQLSTVTVANRIDGYTKVMTATKAFERETVRNDNIYQTLETESAYMNSWYSAQFNMVDAYINGL